MRRLSFGSDRHGYGYARRRRTEPRIAPRVHAPLGDARTVVNVGAGAGAYEPEDRYVVAIEPSATQISVARAALDKAALGLLDDHAHHCVVGPESAQERDEKPAELMDAVGRLVRRG